MVKKASGLWRQLFDLPYADCQGRSLQSIKGAAVYQKKYLSSTLDPYTTLFKGNRSFESGKSVRSLDKDFHTSHTDRNMQTTRGPQTLGNMTKISKYCEVKFLERSRLLHVSALIYLTGLLFEKHLAVQTFSN